MLHLPSSWMSQCYKETHNPFSTQTHERNYTPRPHMSGTPLLRSGSAPLDRAQAHWHARRSPFSGLAVPPFGIPRRILQVLCSLQVRPQPISRSASSTQIFQDRCIISAIWHNRSSHASFFYFIILYFPVGAGGVWEPSITTRSALDCDIRQKYFVKKVRHVCAGAMQQKAPLHLSWFQRCVSP